MRSVSSSSLMTLRSLSAWESCLWAAGPGVGGRADTGLGERDDDEDEEEEDIGHSKEFMSWRLRQKAVACSVPCKKTEKGREEMKSRSRKQVLLLCAVLHPVKPTQVPKLG